MRVEHRLGEGDRAAELILVERDQPLDFETIFGRVAPVEIDLGCGDGAYLAQMAAAVPEHDFVGIERLVGRVRSTGFKLGLLSQSNARVIRAETRSALRQLVPAGSVHAFHIMFPDPWPKRRHHNRRLLNGAFLESLHHALIDGGKVIIATDHLGYFQAVSEALEAAQMLFEVISDDGGSLGAVSTFESRYRSAGLPIYRVWLRKICGAT